MPYNGPLSFLLPDEDDDPSNPGRCQCPITGHSHFYIANIVNRLNEFGLCQCPITGHSHFYELPAGPRNEMR